MIRMSLKKNIHLPLFLIYHLLLLVVLFSFMFFQAFVKKSAYLQTYVGHFPNIHQRLVDVTNEQSRTGYRKIVIVGSSSVAFDLDTHLMENNIKQTYVVSYGLYGGFGIPFMLEHALPYMRSGDVLVVCPEVAEQSLSMYYNGSFMLQACDGNLGLLFEGRTSRAMLRSLFCALPQFSASKIVTKSIVSDGIYSASSFTPYGDIRSELYGTNCMSGSYDETSRIPFDASLVHDDFVSYLNDIAVLLYERGVSMYLHPCPVDSLAVEGDISRSRIFYGDLQKKLCFPIMGDPLSSVMDASLFFDTNFHLNSAGKIFNTRIWIKDIKAELGDTSVTNVPLPSIPSVQASYEDDYSDLDNCDEGAFVYNDKGESWEIVGVEEGSRNAKNLVVPAMHEGRLVSAVRAHSFSGMQSLRCVYIQRNIRLIEDCAFEGSLSLERIVMIQNECDSVAVGQGMLEGTDAVIVVDECNLNTYRTSYRWAFYAQRIYAQRIFSSKINFSGISLEELH